MINLIIILVGAYVVGSIPTGYLFGRLVFGVDVTQHGSGNIGATNIARVFGPRYFFVIFLIDAAKAFLYLLFVSSLGQNYLTTIVSQEIILQLTGIALLIGNAYSMFLGFTGGKGVATMCGILYFLFPPLWFTWFALCWAVLLMVTHRAYVGSIGATIVFVVSYASVHGGLFSPQLYFLFWLLGWIVWRHKSNLAVDRA